MAAHAFQGQRTIDGTPFNLFPAIDVPKVRAGVVWNTVAPRVGVTYDLTGDATNVIKGSYALYFEQRSAGQLSKALNPVGSARIDLGWTDLNGDQIVQANEINQSLIRSVTGFDPASPASLVSTNTVDPAVTCASHERDRSSGSARRWREAWDSTPATCGGGTTTSSGRTRLAAVPRTTRRCTFTPPASTCPTGARCETGDLLCSERDAVQRLRRDEPARLSSRLQRRRTRDPEAFVARLDAERQLFLQHHDRILRFGSVLRRSDQHCAAQRLSVRARCRHRRRWRVEPRRDPDQREMDREAEWLLSVALRRERRRDRRPAPGVPVFTGYQYRLATQSRHGDRRAAGPDRIETVPERRDDGFPAG